VLYDDLVGDPQAKVEELYRRFGLELSTEYKEVLALEHEKASGYKSKHSYSLEEYGLSYGDIRKEFGDIFDYFGFKNDYAA
jgi:uncharacterized protein YfbU (UPF0304 family)